MRVACVAVFAAEFASPIGVHGPAEWHALGMAFVQNGLHREEKILRSTFGFTKRGGCGEARNADQFRRGLLTPGRYRRGRRSTVLGLTIAVASGLGEGETGLLRPRQTPPKRRRSRMKDGRSGHWQPRRLGNIFAFYSLCQGKSIRLVFAWPLVQGPRLETCPRPSGRSA